MKGVPGGGQGEFEGSIPLKSATPAGEKGGRGLTGGEANFDGAGQFISIVWVDAGGCNGVQAAQ